MSSSSFANVELRVSGQLYRCDQPLGEPNSIGEVWRATSVSDPQDQVVVKWLKAELLQARQSADRAAAQTAESLIHRFMSEKDTLIKLNGVDDGRFIPKLLDFNTSGSQPYLVLELVSGREINRWLNETGRFSEVEAIEVAIQLAQALSGVHWARLTNPDLQLQDLMWDRTAQRLRVIDWNVVEPLTEKGRQQDLNKLARFLAQTLTWGTEANKGLYLDTATLPRDWGRELGWQEVTRGLLYRALGQPGHAPYTTLAEWLAALQQLQARLQADFGTLAEEYFALEEQQAWAEAWQLLPLMLAQTDKKADVEDLMRQTLENWQQSDIISDTLIQAEIWYETHKLGFKSFDELLEKAEAAKKLWTVEGLHDEVRLLEQAANQRPDDKKIRNKYEQANKKLQEAKWRMGLLATMTATQEYELALEHAIELQKSGFSSIQVGGENRDLGSYLVQLRGTVSGFSAQKALDYLGRAEKSLNDGAFDQAERIIKEALRFPELPLANKELLQDFLDHVEVTSQRVQQQIKGLLFEVKELFFAQKLEEANNKLKEATAQMIEDGVVRQFQTEIGEWQQKINQLLQFNEKTLNELLEQTQNYIKQHDFKTAEQTLDIALMNLPKEMNDNPRLINLRVEIAVAKKQQQEEQTTTKKEQQIYEYYQRYQWCEALGVLQQVGEREITLHGQQVVVATEVATLQRLVMVMEQAQQLSTIKEAELQRAIKQPTPQAAEQAVQKLLQANQSQSIVGQALDAIEQDIQAGRLDEAKNRLAFLPAELSPEQEKRVAQLRGQWQLKYFEQVLDDIAATIKAENFKQAKTQLAGLPDVPQFPASLSQRLSNLLDENEAKLKCVETIAQDPFQGLELINEWIKQNHALLKMDAVWVQGRKEQAIEQVALKLGQAWDTQRPGESVGLLKDIKLLPDNHPTRQRIEKEAREQEEKAAAERKRLAEEAAAKKRQQEEKAAAERKRLAEEAAAKKRQQELNQFMQSCEGYYRGYQWKEALGVLQSIKQVGEREITLTGRRVTVESELAILLRLVTVMEQAQQLSAIKPDELQFAIKQPTPQAAEQAVQKLVWANQPQPTPIVAVRTLLQQLKQAVNDDEHAIAVRYAKKAQLLLDDLSVQVQKELQPQLSVLILQVIDDLLQAETADTDLINETLYGVKISSEDKQIRANWLRNLPKIATLRQQAQAALAATPPDYDRAEMRLIEAYALTGERHSKLEQEWARVIREAAPIREMLAKAIPPIIMHEAKEPLPHLSDSSQADKMLKPLPPSWFSLLMTQWSRMNRWFSPYISKFDPFELVMIGIIVFGIIGMVVSIGGFVASTILQPIDTATPYPTFILPMPTLTPTYTSTATFTPIPSPTFTPPPTNTPVLLPTNTPIPPPPTPTTTFPLILSVGFPDGTTRTLRLQYITATVKADLPSSLLYKGSWKAGEVVTITKIAWVETGRLLFNVKSATQMTGLYAENFIWHVQIQPDAAKNIIDVESRQPIEGINLSSFANKPITVTVATWSENQLWLQIELPSMSEQPLIIGWIEADQTNLLEPDSPTYMPPSPTPTMLIIPTPTTTFPLILPVGFSDGITRTLRLQYITATAKYTTKKNCCEKGTGGKIRRKEVRYGTNRSDGSISQAITVA